MNISSILKDWLRGGSLSWINFSKEIKRDRVKYVVVETICATTIHVTNFEII
jgi:hypothetical protein